MTARRIIFPGFMPCEDASGDRVPGARAYFYLGDSVTLTTVYADEALSVELPNPVVADTVGTWPEMWADDALSFNVALTDGDGLPLTGAVWSGLTPAKDATLASVALALAAQEAAQAAQTAAEAALAQMQAITAAITGEPFNATSDSNVSVGAGEKAFVLNESGTLYQVGQTVVAAVTAAPANQMTGIVTAAVTDPEAGIQTLTVDVPAGGHAEPDGVGPYDAWTVSLSATAGVQSVAGLAGVITAAALKAAAAVASTDITDFDAAVDNRAAALAIALRR